MSTDSDARIAQIEAIRAVIGDAAADAAIAALRAETAPPQPGQTIAASDGGVVAASPQVSAGGDVRDSALGQGNLVLRDIRIAAGGTLIVGASAADPPPQAEPVEQALVTYLKTFLERYSRLNLQGLDTGRNQQARIALRAVFINLRSDVQVSELAGLVSEDRASPAPSARRRGQPSRPDQLSPDARRWLDELLTPEERALLFAQPTDARPTEQQQQLQQKLAGPRTALELIRHEPALVLLGDPGSGKTTVLRYLALGFAHARLCAGDDVPLPPELAWAGPLPLPVLVQLRRFAAGLNAAPSDGGPLLQHIEEHLREARLEPLARHLLARLDAGEVIVLLDGLDEIADDQRRRWAVEAVAAFQSRFPTSRVVLTSRIYAYRDPFLLPPPFQVARLQPLAPAAQDDFIARWYRAALLQGSELVGAEQAAAAAQRSRDLVEGLDRRPRLREIAANPLLLTMVALLHWSGMGLPQQRAQLYERCLELLLEQWEQRRADDGPAGLAAALEVGPRLTSSGARLALIQPVAYELQRLGHEEASHREVTSWLLERFLNLSDDDAARARALVRRFLGFLEGRSGLLIARDLNERYAFPHKTFQEYLAARELIYLGLTTMRAEVLAHRHDPTWREVILLVAGHLVASGQPEQARTLARALLDADPEGTPAAYRSAALVGELVEELADNLDRDGRRLREETIRELVALVEGGQLSASERVAAAFTLGRLGDPRLPTPEQPGYWCRIDPVPFWFGDDREKKPLKQMELPYPYQLGRYPVTNAEYARFVEADGYAQEQWWTPEGWAFLKPGGHWYDDQKQSITLPRLWFHGSYNRPTQPVVGVSWYEAAAYCCWLTAQGHTEGWLPVDEELRLPTELEWERAARHTDWRRYPWGDDKPDSERANYDQTKISIPSPVGCFPAGRAACGAHDLAGNVWEWTATVWEQKEQVRPEKDFTQSKTPTVRGGAFYNEIELLCCGSRDRDIPFGRNDNWSFRVFWSPRST